MNHNGLFKRALRVVGYRWLTTFPKSSFPFPLEFGGMWLARNDDCGMAVLHDAFEPGEVRFVERFLKKGMVVLDVGAHHGFYTLLASRRVGSAGKVFSFEPSPRERRHLLRHIQINRCENVRVEALAMGSHAAQADLFVAHGSSTGFNSLRPPAVDGPTTVCKVCVSTLDDYVREKQLTQVDFVKLDVEGAELDVLRGAAQLFVHGTRPVVLCEVQDVRTRPWGHAAKLVIEQLEGFGYRCFRVLASGELEPLPIGQESFDGNYVGVPIERVSTFDMARLAC